jgi:hypothetical protein
MFYTLFIKNIPVVSSDNCELAHAMFDLAIADRIRSILIEAADENVEELAGAVLKAEVLNAEAVRMLHDLGKMDKLRVVKLIRELLDCGMTPAIRIYHNVVMEFEIKYTASPVTADGVTTVISYATE